MGNTLTLEELAELTAAPADQLREWRSLGLIGRESAETFRPEDVQRIRLIQLLLRRGIGLAAIARVEQEQGFLSRYCPDLPRPSTCPTRRRGLSSSSMSPGRLLRSACSLAIV